MRAEGEEQPASRLWLCEFTALDGTSDAQRIEFDEDGNPRGFPKKVFNKDRDLAAELLDVRE